VDGMLSESNLEVGSARARPTWMVSFSPSTFHQQFGHWHRSMDGLIKLRTGETLKNYTLACVQYSLS